MSSSTCCCASEIHGSRQERRTGDEKMQPQPNCYSKRSTSLHRSTSCTSSAARPCGMPSACARWQTSSAASRSTCRVWCSPPWARCERDIEGQVSPSDRSSWAAARRSRGRSQGRASNSLPRSDAVLRCHLRPPTCCSSAVTWRCRRQPTRSQSWSL